MCAVTRDLSSEEDSALVRMMQAVAVPALGNVCHVFMNGLNRVQVSYAKLLTIYLVSFRLFIIYCILIFVVIGVWKNRCMVWKNCTPRCWRDLRVNLFLRYVLFALVRCRKGTSLCVWNVDLIILFFPI